MADTYHIVLQPEAVDGMESAYRYLEQDSPEAAQRWALGLMEAINSLQTMPGRCALAPESASFPQEIRQLLYGRGRNQYRILFTVKGDAVHILHIRHHARQHLRPEE